MDDRYYTITQVAERLQVSRQAIYNWISEGRLRAVKVGRHTRVPESSIEEFLKPIEPGEPVADDTEE